MSTRVQKGGTVFRPVTKARPRAAESVPRYPSASQDNHASHPQSEVHPTQLSVPHEDTSAVTIPTSALVPQLSLPHVGQSVTANHGAPIVIPSFRAPPVQVDESRLPLDTEEAFLSADPSNIEVLIADQTLHQSRRVPQPGSTRASTPQKFFKKVRRPETPAFDANADPGEDLDPTSVTMAALCEDTGQGRISSKAAQIVDNHLSWKKSNREKRTRMRSLMEAKKYGKQVDPDTAPGKRPEAESGPSPAAGAIPGPSSTQPVSGNVEDTSGQGFDYSQDISTSRYNVQVRIGPNGETIVDEESLFVDRNAEEDTTEYTHVEESDVTKFVNSATYSKRFRGSRWSAEETELFYDALSQFGENYELISYVLPGRDRKACKNKFKTEDKKNPQRINYCLNNRKPYDIQTLSRMTGKDFSGPTPEIRAPTVLSLAEPSRDPETDRFQEQTTTRPSKSSTTQHAEEVIGDISSFDRFDP